VTAKDGPGQADKAAAEKKTASVAVENRATADRAANDRAAANDKTDGADGERVDSRQPPVADGDVAAPVDATPARSDGAPARPEGLDPGMAPYPQYEDEKVDDLRSHAEARGVEINRDVEKALLIKGLRDSDHGDPAEAKPGPAVDASERWPSYDFMPLEELRKLAKERDVELKKSDVKAHLVTELRAADSSGFAKES
jgi:hypothetical protein